MNVKWTFETSLAWFFRVALKKEAGEFPFTNPYWLRKHGNDDEETSQNQAKLIFSTTQC